MSGNGQRKKFFKVREKSEFYFESRKIDISLNTIEGWKKDLGSLLSQRYFSLMKKKNVLKIITLNERRSRN